MQVRVKPHNRTLLALFPVPLEVRIIFGYLQAEGGMVMILLESISCLVCWEVLPSSLLLIPLIYLVLRLLHIMYYGGSDGKANQLPWLCGISLFMDGQGVFRCFFREFLLLEVSGIGTLSGNLFDLL